MKRIIDLLYLPVFIAKYKKNYISINNCIKDYFMYYTLIKKEV